MKITNISIRRNYYPDDGAFVCEISVEGQYGEMKLRLDGERTQAVIEHVADLIVDGAQDVARNLARQALDHRALDHRALEHQSAAPGTEQPL